MENIDLELLHEIPLFQKLDEQELATLAAQLDVVQLLGGQLVFAMGDPGNKMYVVQKGRVELFLQDKADQRVVLEIVKPGDLFGELSLLHNEPRSASAKTLENTILYAIDQHDLEVLVTSHPPAALDMMSGLGKRIREANTLVRERVSRNVNEEMPTASGLGERLSDFLTAVAGDIRFVYFSVIWFFVWITLNLNIIPGLPAFDPFPFGLLTMVVSLEAIFLSLFVLISQNRQTAREKVRNDIEYDVNLKAEVEIRALSKQVEELQQLMLGYLATITYNQQQNTAKPK